MRSVPGTLSLTVCRTWGFHVWKRGSGIVTSFAHACTPHLPLCHSLCLSLRLPLCPVLCLPLCLSSCFELCLPLCPRLCLPVVPHCGSNFACPLSFPLSSILPPTLSPPHFLLFPTSMSPHIHFVPPCLPLCFQACLRLCLLLCLWLYLLVSPLLCLGLCFALCLPRCLPLRLPLCFKCCFPLCLLLCASCCLRAENRNLVVSSLLLGSKARLILIEGGEIIVIWEINNTQYL